MKKYIVWGAGAIGKTLISFTNKKNIPVECIVDKDSQKWGTTIEGIKITSPEKALKNASDYEIVIAVGQKYIDEVKKELADYDIVGQDIQLYSDIIKFDNNGSDVAFGGVPGYIYHDDTNILLKNSYVDKIFMNKIEGSCRLLVHEQNRSGFQHIYDFLHKLNTDKKYTREVFKMDSDIESAEYDLEKINVYSYASEWAPEMYRSMCLFYVDFLGQCVNNGVYTEKLSYYDVIFYNGDFLYENILNLRNGSISYKLLESFVDKFISILYLMETKKYDRAFSFIANDWHDMTIKDIKGYIPDERYNEYEALLERISTLYMTGDYTALFTTLKKSILSINLNLRDVYQWDSYQTSEYESLNNIDRWSGKQKIVIDMIKSTDARTMIDLAGNMGWYCVAMSNDMDYTVVADIDYNCIDFAFKYIRDNGIKNVYPIQLNMIAPPLDKYKNLSIGNTGIEPWKKSAISRYKADVVVALAIEHHLACSQQLSFDEIINQMALFTNKWLIVEYVHREDSCVADFLDGNSQFDWYNKDHFLESLNKQFNVVKSANTSATRTVFLCERFN